MKEDVNKAIHTLGKHVNGKQTHEEWENSKELEGPLEKAWRHASDIIVKFGTGAPNREGIRLSDTEKVPLTIKQEGHEFNVTLRLTGINPPSTQYTNAVMQVICWGGNEHLEDPFFTLTKNALGVDYNYKMGPLELKHIKAIETILTHIEQGLTEKANESAAPTAA